MKIHLVTLAVVLCGYINTPAQTKGGKQFTDSFMQDSCTFETTGRNTYFILEPGFQLVFEGTDSKGATRLVITVLNETK